MRHWDFFDTFHCQGQSHCRSFTSSLRSHMCGAACASSIAHILYIASQSVRYGEVKTRVCSTNGHIRHSSAPPSCAKLKGKEVANGNFNLNEYGIFPTCNYTRGKYIRLKFEAWKYYAKAINRSFVVAVLLTVASTSRSCHTSSPHFQIQICAVRTLKSKYIRCCGKKR